MQRRSGSLEERALPVFYLSRQLVRRGSQQQKSAVATSHTLYPLNNAAVIELRRGYQLGELHKSAPLCASSHAWKYLFTLRNTAETECVIQGRQL